MTKPVVHSVTMDTRGLPCVFRNPTKKLLPSRFSANKIVISNVPTGVRFEQLEQILLQFGQVKEIEKISQRDGPTQVVQIAFESAEQAHK